MTERNRKVLLARRPQGAVTEDNFRIVDAPLPEPADGEVPVKNAITSADDLLVYLTTQNLFEQETRQNEAANNGCQPCDKRRHNPSTDAHDAQTIRYKRGHKQTDERCYKGNTTEQVRRVLRGNSSN